MTQEAGLGYSPPPAAPAPFLKHQSVELRFPLFADLMFCTQFRLGGESLKESGGNRSGLSQSLRVTCCWPLRSPAGLSHPSLAGAARAPLPGGSRRRPTRRRRRGRSSSPGPARYGAGWVLAARGGALRLRDLLIVLKKGRKGGNKNKTNRGKHQQNLGSGAAGMAAFPSSRRWGERGPPAGRPAAPRPGAGRCAAGAPHLP